MKNMILSYLLHILFFCLSYIISVKEITKEGNLQKICLIMINKYLIHIIKWRGMNNNNRKERNNIVEHGFINNSYIKKDKKKRWKIK